jgi:hypothetical protein
MALNRTERYCASLLLDYLNERFDTEMAVTGEKGDALIASDGSRRIGVYVAALWEREAAGAWEDRLRAMEERLDGSTEGSFLLWTPPQAPVPDEEPAASDFVARVSAAAAVLDPGARTEVLFPKQVKMAKTREEGGYASVVGGLSRWWTRVTEKVQGTFTVDSSAVHRLTHDGTAREELWDAIGRLSHSVGVGQMTEFEVEEAWTLQRLSASAEGGFAIVGAPPQVDPTDGILVRRTARKRLQAANEALGGLDVTQHAVALIGAYEYGELETAGATLKAVDPALYSKLEIICVLADGDVRPTFMPRELA